MTATMPKTCRYGTVHETSLARDLVGEMFFSPTIAISNHGPWEQLLATTKYDHLHSDYYSYFLTTIPDPNSDLCYLYNK